MSRTLEQVIASTRQQMRTVPTLTERRRHQRRVTSCLAFIRPHDVLDAGYSPANVWDVSEEGIGLLLDYRLPLEEALDISFRHQSIQDRLAIVVHVTKRADGWHIGCRLDQPFTEIELRAMGAFAM